MDYLSVYCVGIGAVSTLLIVVFSYLKLRKSSPKTAEESTKTKQRDIKKTTFAKIQKKKLKKKEVDHIEDSSVVCTNEEKVTNLKPVKQVESIPEKAKDVVKKVESVRNIEEEPQLNKQERAIAANFALASAAQGEANLSKSKKKRLKQLLKEVPQEAPLTAGKKKKKKQVPDIAPEVKNYYSNNATEEGFITVLSSKESKKVLKQEPIKITQKPIETAANVQKGNPDKNKPASTSQKQAVSDVKAPIVLSPENISKLLAQAESIEPPKSITKKPEVPQMVLTSVKQPANQKKPESRTNTSLVQNNQNKPDSKAAKIKPQSDAQKLVERNVDSPAMVPLDQLQASINIQAQHVKKIASLEQELKSLSSAQKLKAEHDELKIKYENLNNSNAIIQQELTRILSSKNNFEHEKKKMDAALKNKTTELEGHIVHANVLAEQLNNSVLKVKQLEEQLKDITKKNGVMEVEIAEKTKRVQALTAKVDDLEKKMGSGAQADVISKLQLQIDGDVKEINRLRSAAKDQEATIKRLKEELTKNEEVDRLKEENLRYTKLNDQISESEKVARIELELVHKQLKETKEELDTLKNLPHGDVKLESSSEKEDLVSQLQEKQEALVLTEQILEQLKRSVEEEEHKWRSSLASSEEECNSLRQKLALIESVRTKSQNSHSSTNGDLVTRSNGRS